MNQKQADKIRQNVRESYAKVAEASNQGDSCGIESSCCGVSADINAVSSTRLGYTEEEVGSVPQGADMGLGCGNPKVLASLQLGEAVLDLGSGGGFDAFLAAKEVGDQGKVIGVDMTPTMVSKARANAIEGGFQNVDFRLGEIEHLPVEDNSIDVIISNCVINLSPDKQQVFHDAYRALKPGGRLAISDVVASVELPDQIRNDLELYSGCMAGACQIEELETYLVNSGFTDISIVPKDESRTFIKDWSPGKGIEDYVMSAHIQAKKPVSPRGTCC